MADNTPAHRYRAGDADRDRILTLLQDAYEAGRLGFDELGERQEQALRSRFTDELAPLVADLPGAGDDPALPTTRHGAVPETAANPSITTVTVMSGRDVLVESGVREVTDFAWWGGNNYDLRDALGPGRTVTLNLHAIMAGSDIHVPEGVRVIDQSLAIMAGNDIASHAQGDGSNGTLILKGFLFWAGNDVKLGGASGQKRRGRR